MDFYNWTFIDPLKINNLGIPEPEAKKLVHPDILFIPMVAFDKNLNRLGYGGGYYDRFIEKLSRKKNIIKIGLALSCQKIKRKMNKSKFINQSPGLTLKIIFPII